MKTWTPVTAENSLINGRAAVKHPDLWKRIRWEGARYHQLACGTVLKAPLRGGAVSHVISPDPQALALEPGALAFPIALPTFNELPPISPTGFCWMLAEEEPRGMPTGSRWLIGTAAVPAPAEVRPRPRPVLPMPTVPRTGHAITQADIDPPFGDIIGA